MQAVHRLLKPGGRFRASTTFERIGIPAAWVPLLSGPDAGGMGGMLLEHSLSTSGCEMDDFLVIEAEPRLPRVPHGRT